MEALIEKMGTGISGVVKFEIDREITIWQRLKESVWGGQHFIDEVISGSYAKVSISYHALI